MACDCDGEDTWWDNYEDCDCNCEEYFDALEDEYEEVYDPEIGYDYQRR